MNEMSDSISVPLSYRSEATGIIVGVGLMGQFMAERICSWIGLRKLILVDHAPTISVGVQRVELSDFAGSLREASGGRTEVVAEVVDITDEDAAGRLFEKHAGIQYWMHTAGISPRPLTPPEKLTKSDVLGACEINLWGAMNVLKHGTRLGAFLHGSRGVILLSTSATVGSEGRASAAYEVSKAGLANLLTLHARYFVDRYGLILNGLAPSPLRGHMAAQNPVSARRLQAVEQSMPLGGLTEPKHIAAAAMYFWAEECWCVGEVMTVDGGYTKHRPIFGDLS